MQSRCRNPWAKTVRSKRGLHTARASHRRACNCGSGHVVHEAAADRVAHSRRQPRSSRLRGETAPPRTRPPEREQKTHYHEASHGHAQVRRRAARAAQQQALHCRRHLRLHRPAHILVVVPRPVSVWKHSSLKATRVRVPAGCRVVQLQLPQSGRTCVGRELRPAVPAECVRLLARRAVPGSHCGAAAAPGADAAGGRRCKARRRPASTLGQVRASRRTPREPPTSAASVWTAQAVQASPCSSWNT